MFTKINDIKIYYSFNQGIKVRVYGPDSLYLVELREYPKGDDKPKYVECYTISNTVRGYYDTFEFDGEFYGDYEILVYKTDYEYGLTKIFSHRFDDRDRIVEFNIDTDDLMEAELWSQRIDLYTRLHGCRPIVKSKFKDINKKYHTYYNVTGIERYKTYRIGRYPKSSTDFKTSELKHEGFLWFGGWKIFWSYQHPRSWNFLNSQEVVDDILGL
jgi:hypothetical protein